MLNEKSLHASLKAWYAQPGDRIEEPVDGSLIDIVRGDSLIEIQTRGFSALRHKLGRLVRGHPVRLVYPIAAEKWIVRLGADGITPISRRKSPRHGAAVDLFRELVSFPRLLAHPNFTLEVLLIREEELRRHDPSANWRRRGWVTAERRLLGVVDSQVFAAPEDLACLLPADLDEPFTTAELAAALARPRRLAQQMAYCLRSAGVLEEVGRRGRGVLYARGKDEG